MDSLRTYFGNDASGSAFKTVDGQLRIIGKWGQVEIVGEYFDIWLVKPDISPLSGQKLGALLTKLRKSDEFTVLNGEAYYQTTDIEYVRQTLPLLGVRRKRRLTDETRKKLANHLSSLRD